MDSGVQVASLFGVLGLDDSDWNRKLNNAKKQASGFAGRLESWSGKARGLAGDLALVFGPVALGLGAATRSAIRFDEAMSNTAAVLGITRQEQSLLARDILAIGRTARAGPQRVAEAFYDIVGGVADAASHLDILNASIATSEAGNADLAGVTKALIATMNGFGLKAKQAARASDVLTRTVGVGVGTMDELATAIPDVAGLAHSLGIELEDTGAILGFLSTKGNTFNQSATQMRAMMLALLNPNERMKDALAALGVESGKAAIEQYGLIGVFQEMHQRVPNFETDMAALLGSSEALNAVTALLGEGAAGFLANFTVGLEGATAAAREIQNASPAAQWDLFVSKVQGAAITLGSTLVPALIDTLDNLQPVIDGVTNWIGANPELAGQLALAAVAMTVLSPIMFGVSTALGAIRLAVLGVSAAFALLTAPVTLIVGLVAGMVKAYLDNFLGFRDFIDNTVRPFLDKTFGWIKGVFENTFGWIQQYILTPIEDTLNRIMDMLGGVKTTTMNLNGASWPPIEVVTTDSGFSFGPFQPGFADGGWTGGASGPIAGVVHPEEWVIPTKGGPLLRERGAARNDELTVLATIYANDIAGGRRAADGLEVRLKELRRARGMT